MDRSKCVMCGKVRNRKFLTQFNNLEGNKIWLCNREITYSNLNYIKINEIHHVVNKCQIRYLKMLKEILDEKIENYNAAKKCLSEYDKIIQDKNVTPELTFLLQ